MARGLTNRRGAKPQRFRREEASNSPPEAPLRTSRPEQPDKLRERIKEFSDDSLLQRDDCVVGYRDALRANLCAALGDVAQADAVRGLQFVESILRIERVHLERGCINQKPRTDELIVHRVLAKHVTNILAQEALDAFSKLLNSIDVV